MTEYTIYREGMRTRGAGPRKAIYEGEKVGGVGCLHPREARSTEGMQWGCARRISIVMASYQADLRPRALKGDPLES